MSTYKHEVYSIFDPAKPDENVFMYTVGLYPERQELCALNVPRNCVDEVGRMMNYLSTRTLLPGQTACFNYHIKPDESADMSFVLDKPSNAGRKRLINKYLLQVNRFAQVLELVPIGSYPTICTSVPLKCKCCGSSECKH